MFNGFTVATIAFMMTIMDKECEDTKSDIDKNKWQLGCMVGEESSAAALCKLMHKHSYNVPLKDVIRFFSISLNIRLCNYFI